MPAKSDQALPLQEMSIQFTGKRLPKLLNESKVGAIDGSKKRKLIEKDDVQRWNFSDGSCAASLTSSIYTPVTENKGQAFSEKEIREVMYDEQYRASKEPIRALVGLITSKGKINLQLECHKAPKTCHNFLLLCRRGYYNNVAFHRVIPGFMMQGGDPTGTGRGGRSAWNEWFEDEIDPDMSHSSRGVLSMANKGPNTNSSQFFITFAPATFLDGKHTVFGKVVAGLETLQSIEMSPTGSNDRPLDDIKIEKVEVYEDPFESGIPKKTDKESSEAEKLLAYWKKTAPVTVSKPGSIGKYIKK